MSPKYPYCRSTVTALFALCSAFAASAGAAEAEAVKVGLVAALSGNSALSGEAITRGLSIAIDEINCRREELFHGLYTLTLLANNSRVG